MKTHAMLGISSLACLLMLVAAKPIEAAELNATVAKIEAGYGYIVLTNVTGLTPGARVLISTSSGAEKEFRIEKIGSWGASAIPKTDMEGIQVGAVARPSNATPSQYAQDRPLATREETQREMAHAEAESRRSSAANFQAFLGATAASATAVSQGANPAVVSLNGQSYLNEQQRRIAAGQEPEATNTADLAQRLSAGTQNPAPSPSAATAASGASNGVSGIPPGSYASWTNEQKQQAANALKAMSERQCKPYTDAAMAGSVRASYEAATCTLGCYVNNLPNDYPRLDEYKRDALANYQNARSMGSNMPYPITK
jgi:hypothetical protein